MSDRIDPAARARARATARTIQNNFGHLKEQLTEVQLRLSSLNAHLDRIDGEIERIKASRPPTEVTD